MTSISTTGAIQKKIQEKEQQSSTTISGDDWGGFFKTLGIGLLYFAVFTVLGINIGYIMKRQNADAKLPVDENVAPYGTTPDAYASYPSHTVNPPMSIAYLGAKGGSIQQSWAYKEAKNPGSLSWILWEWFRNSAKFSWVNSRSALKSVMETLNEMANETGILAASYVFMILWPLVALLGLAVIGGSYLISLGGVLMTTLTKWNGLWQLAINLVLTFMLQGMVLMPIAYTVGEIMALLRYLLVPITRTVMVAGGTGLAGAAAGGVETNYFWYQLRSNYMIVWFFLFALISISATSTLGAITSGGIITGIIVIYIIMLIQYKLASLR